MKKMFSLDIARKFQQDAAQIAKDFHFDLFGGKFDNKPVSVKTAKPIKVKAKVEIEPTGRAALAPAALETERFKQALVGPKKTLEMPFEIRMKLEGFEEIRKQKEEFDKRVTSIFESGAEGLAESFGKGFADMLSGGGLGAMFKNIAATLGDFISQLGSLLIKEAIAVKAFKDAFKVLLANPIAAVAAGIGLVALGQIIKNVALPKPKGFADGGLVSGPTLGLVGEGRGTNRANPEVIAPLDKLKKFIGGGQTFPAYLPVHEVSGDTLRMWYKRANNSGRMFG
jgi:hypothetical protein